MTAILFLLAEAQRRWGAAGIVLRPGASEGEIRGFEQRHQVRLPASLAEYFRTVDGIGEGGADEHQIRFWPLAQVRPAIEELPDEDPAPLEGYFVFADHASWAHGYAVQLGPKSGDVVLLGEGAPVLVASSFEEFMALYVSDPEALLDE